MSGRGKSQESLDLIAAARRILEEIKPASVRAVCYRLFTEKLIPSMSKNHTNAVSRHLVFAREHGVIPWDWIVDETRRRVTWSTYSNPDGFLDSMRDRYVRDAWQDQPSWVEVWSEKSTVNGTLMPVLNEYAVNFRSFHGHTSATALHGACSETRRRGRNLIALYVGDWDPSGLHMSEIDLPTRIKRYYGNISVRRIAINKPDTRPSKGVPSFDPIDKKSDPRYRWFVDNYDSECFELDALNPRELRERVEDSIVSLIDSDAWEHASRIGAAELESMRNYFDRWPGISMPANKYSPDGAA